MRIMSDITLRSNIAKVIDVYGTIIGAVPLQLLFYHVNNEDRFEKTGFSEEEILEELEVLTEYGEIETVTAWRTRERSPRITGRKVENFRKVIYDD